MIPKGYNEQTLPLGMVNGNNYGRYEKISDEETFNMIISDGWLVPSPGYRVVASPNPDAKGRRIFYSSQWGNAIAVIGNVVYGVMSPTPNNSRLSFFTIGFLETFFGSVFIDENIAGQIIICDGTEIYVYNWRNPSNPPLIKAVLPIDTQTNAPIIPGYITYQDGYAITVDKKTSRGYLSNINDALDWNWSAIGGPVFFSIQTKATNAVAAVRAPGRGNLLYVIGEVVTEMWNDTGGARFPYTRNSSVSIDYGCISPNTIAAMDTIICWLGVNERSGPVIMVCAGSESMPISDDGIDYFLAKLKNPSQSYGFFFKQDGHLFYQITFTDPQDNFTLLYDFNTKKFFTMTDENMNYHIAQSVAFMGGNYYFVSLNDGNIYQMSTDLYEYDYTLDPTDDRKAYEIPRIRVTSNKRLSDNSRFTISNLNFVMEQGDDPNFKGYNPNQDIQPYIPRVDLSLSKNGSSSFGSYVSKQLNPLGKRKNMVRWWKMGMANEVSFQFRFWSKTKVVVGEGEFVIQQPIT